MAIDVISEVTATRHKNGCCGWLQLLASIHGGFQTPAILHLFSCLLLCCWCVQTSQDTSPLCNRCRRQNTSSLSLFVPSAFATRAFLPPLHSHYRCPKWRRTPQINSHSVPLTHRGIATNDDLATADVRPCQSLPSTTPKLSSSCRSLTDQIFTTYSFHDQHCTLVPSPLLNRDYSLSCLPFGCCPPCDRP